LQQKLGGDRIAERREDKTQKNGSVVVIIMVMMVMIQAKGEVNAVSFAPNTDRQRRKNQRRRMERGTD